ncbi:MAG: hypothetical protein ABJC05_06110 [Pyrinomonadaceae bacterium]
MFRRNRLWYSFVMILALASFVGITVQAQKRRPRSVSSGPPFLELSASPSAVRLCAGEGSTVKLLARATSQSGNALRYRWATEGGRLTGDGANTTWDLSGMQPGVYRATVEVDSGTDNTCAAFSSAAVAVTECAAPLCPNVTLSCPDNVIVGQPITFSANIAGGSRQTNPTYDWTTTAGRIIDGQGTRTITVDTAGLAGQSIVASLKVRANGLECPASCAVQFPVPKLDCRKFDEFPNIPRNEEKARLDNFAIDLQNAPGDRAYVVVYPGRENRAGDAELRMARVVDYLVNYRGLDAGRIVKLIGPARDALTVSLWSCPIGATPPRP